ncbi:helix-turn-helix protein [Chitinophaga niastensis]|uniref:Helix-turn-helix protein n=1 Tax=Chitinophaga niastensis TaxID=536980 RepID=A0A2P8HNU0_CHINA|nr:helix-turn-helix transcriptional regulator [Chitinophaga niastensis]PSL47882.1 helix-turn-helix protein [Chitinophaga niastensis]
MNDEQKKKFLALVSDKTSSFEERVTFRTENKAWLAKSGALATKIIIFLDAHKITQKELAERLGISPQQVNKILQGQENMTLQTITAIETALNIELIKVVSNPVPRAAINKNSDHA